MQHGGIIEKKLYHKLPQQREENGRLRTVERVSTVIGLLIGGSHTVKHQAHEREMSPANCRESVQIG